MTDTTIRGKIVIWAAIIRKSVRYHEQTMLFMVRILFQIIAAKMENFPLIMSITVRIALEFALKFEPAGTAPGRVPGPHQAFAGPYFRLMGSCGAQNERPDAKRYAAR